jgi:hypothetical protein
MCGMRVSAALVLALAVCAASLVSDTSARPRAAGVVDTTLSCRTALIGGARSVTALAHAGTGRRGGSWRRPPFATVTSGQPASAFGLLDPALVWVSAGRPAADASVVRDAYANATYPYRTWGTLAWNRSLCGPSGAHVRLDARGLAGGAAGPFEEGFECPASRRVLVRVRATAAGAVRASGYRQFARYRVPFERAEIAVETAAGKPLAYADVLSSGKARVLAAASCTPS